MSKVVQGSRLTLLTRAAFVEAFARTTGRPADSIDADAPLDLDPIERYLLSRLLLDAGVPFEEATLDRIATLADAHRLAAVDQAVSVLDVRAGAPLRDDLSSGDASMRGRGVWLRVPAGTDHEWVHALLTHPRNLGWAPLNGQTPSVGELEALLAPTSLCQYVIASNESGRRCGWVRAASVDLHNGHGYLEAVFDPELVRAGWPLEGAELFITQLFSAWRLRKVYLELPDPQWQILSPGTQRRLDQQGTLRSHRFAGGRWCDVHICALTADALQAVSGWSSSRDVAQPPPLTSTVL